MIGITALCESVHFICLLIVQLLKLSEPGYWLLVLLVLEDPLQSVVSISPEVS